MDDDLIYEFIQEIDMKSSLLKSVVSAKEDGGEFPPLQDALDFFEVKTQQKKTLYSWNIPY